MSVPGRPRCPTYTSIHRTPADYLVRFPVDLLILGSGDSEAQTTRTWLQRISRARVKGLQPRWVLEFWCPEELFSDEGPMSKAWTSIWGSYGYVSSCKLIHTLRVGGVVDSIWLMVSRVSEDRMIGERKQELRRGLAWPDVGEIVVRPMGNCLRTHNIPRKAYQNTGQKLDLPMSDRDAMPRHPGSIIQTPKGRRRLLNDELARGLGVPKGWLQEAYPLGQLLKQTVPLHTLEYASEVLLSQPYLQDEISNRSSEVPSGEWCIKPDPPLTNPDYQPRPYANQQPPVTIDWTPPDLGPSSSWTIQRVLNLIHSCLQYQDTGPMIEDGLLRLRRHRQNYDDKGPRPQHLQILWWEFPPEEWDTLRDGSSMHFLKEPSRRHTPNSPMTDTQIRIAEEFVEELVSLGVLLPVSKDEMVSNGPLFTLPKPGQPGQWRIISDMRRGGQNEASAADPTVFPKPGTILEQLYPSGWTAVVDASKFFYQFPTYPTEQKYLGCIHPRNPEQCYVYSGLPMGATASPAHAGRYGTALLRKLRETSPLFQGTWKINTWWSHFSGASPYNSSLGHGLVLMGEDGLPACLIWVHCDDFLIHGPTLEKTLAGVRAFLDLTVDVGMLCNPAKITPPGQSVRYTGLIFDTRGQPTLRIPPAKSSRARALVDYSLAHCTRISRLSLAVVIGTLESLSAATPDNIGRTYLRHLQDDLHPADWMGEDLPYYSFTPLSTDSQEELQFWRWLLDQDPGRPARGERSGTLVPSFGDGSGTGTGGTVCYPDESGFEMWMGTWDPRVFHFSSNWKELQTLLSTLERAQARPNAASLRGVTFFYFTDNLVTYYVTNNGTSTSPGLHRLVVQIKRLSIRLGIHLEVVHVPGTLIIEEGWTALPQPPSSGYTALRRHLCVGCHRPLGANLSTIWRCRFCDTGFKVGSFRALPCGVSYHLGCVRIGLPFTTRLASNRGLGLPPDPLALPNFICEACTVRAVRQREISRHPVDTALLLLERARMVDTANHWATGTLGTYRSKFHVLASFEKDLQCPTLTPTVLPAPPHGPAIRLMWAQERYSLYPSAWRRKQAARETTVTFGTIRGLRSAASHFWLVDHLATQSDRLTLGYKDRPHLVDRCSPTDEISYTYFTDGMRRRLGDHPRPSAVLLLRHILWLDTYYLRLFRDCVDVEASREICRAGVAHAMAYLGWLRAMETFTLCWRDIVITTPGQGPTLGLPMGIGAVQLRLAPQTKTNQVASADVVLAFTAASGISLGTWLQRLRFLLPSALRRPDSLIFSRPDGNPWTSHHYRHTHLYPALAVCRALGDPFLQRFDDSVPTKTLASAFWGFNTYRRTGRTVASRKRSETRRAATPAEVVEHGRWRVSRSSLDMPLAYLDWSVEDRLCLTLFCM